MEIIQFLRNKQLRERYTSRGGMYLILLESCGAICPSMPGVKVGRTHCFTQRLISYAKLYKGCRVVALCVVPRHNLGERIAAFETQVLHTVTKQHKIPPVFQREWFGRQHYSTIKNVLLSLHHLDFPKLHRWVRNTSNNGFDKRYHNTFSNFEDDREVVAHHDGAFQPGFYTEDENVVCFQTQGRLGHETRRTIIRPQRDYLHI